jgi:hypothetical protein
VCSETKATPTPTHQGTSKDSVATLHPHITSPFFGGVICYYLIGGFNPSEKYESQLRLLFPRHGQIKNVPNHKPVIQ